MMNTTVALASYQQKILFFNSWDDYENTQRQRLSHAVALGARWIVFPEYGAMELASLLSDTARADIKVQLMELQRLLPAFLALHQALADAYNVLIVAPSLPVAVGDEFHNRAYVFRPGKPADFQEKLVMTRFEREQWGVAAGSELKVFSFDEVKFSILICYDCEFPLLAHRVASAGAEIMLVPSCTDTLAGYYRVRVGAQARALENQCYVVQSCTVGEAAWSAAVDENHGAAAVYTAPDYGWPANGVLEAGELDQEQCLFAVLDIKHLRWVRQHGQVLNVRDWPESEPQRFRLVQADE
ncbi:MAG TPA: carbon-nitrogen hydrolase family protein [Pseudomonadales bacterium]|nr:carbon-nitrogen hydrolase family protein [Pseudomonadales bacterium]